MVAGTSLLETLLCWVATVGVAAEAVPIPTAHNATPASETRGGDPLTSIDAAYPFAGSWLVQNSPANRVPSHGTSLFGSSYAIDFVPLTDAGRTAPITISSLIRREPLDRFAGFGRPILAPVDGTVLIAYDTEPDHPAYRGLPSIVYALTQARRAAAGWRALAGNHIMIDSGGIVVALCHLRQGSAKVLAGQHVKVGDVLGLCGNSGNSTEPHVHVQAVDSRDIDNANAVEMTFNKSLPANGHVVRAESR